MQQIVDVPVHGPPQAQTSERIQEQTAVPGLQSIPQKRTSKRIVEWNVDVSELQVIPQKRIPKRIVEQIADDSVQQVIPQKRISERIVKQNVDEFMQVIPQEQNSERIQGHVYEGGSTSSSAAVQLDTAEWLGDRGFRTFSPAQKSATNRPESSAALGAEPSSWPPAAYAESMAFDEDGSVTESGPKAGAEDGAVTRLGFRPWRVCVRFLEFQQGRPGRLGVPIGRHMPRCTFAHSWAAAPP